MNVQIFGVKNSQATRAAERFFKERRVDIHYVDLQKKALAPGEIKRFTDRFGGLTGLLDTEGKEFVDAGLKYLKGIRIGTAGAHRTDAEAVETASGAGSWKASGCGPR